MIVYIIIGIFCLIVIYCLITFNSLFKLNNKFKVAFSQMDVYLKMRMDLIPDLVATVKSYAEHEQDTIKKINEISNKDYNKLSYTEKIKINNQISYHISKLLALKEAYPELKTNEQFLKLQRSLRGIEDEISVSKQHYNAVVKDYNNIVKKSPSNIVAKLLGCKPKSMFESENMKVNM